MEEVEEIKKDIRDIKEFILINVIGLYHSKNIEKDFKKLLEENKEYLKK